MTSTRKLESENLREKRLVESLSIRSWCVAVGRYSVPIQPAHVYLNKYVHVV